MASEVSICNIALSHLGDTGSVASINPPEGSAQAEHCARFYPVARDALLAVHDWGFATKRIQLAQLSDTTAGWQYAYAHPNDAIRIVAILCPDQADPGSTGMPAAAPNAFACEVGANNTRIIYCNVERAIAKYVAKVVSTERFSALFTVTLTWQLASMLAGPILKGDAGMSEAKRCAQMAEAYLVQAQEQDARQQSQRLVHAPEWIQARGAVVGHAGRSNWER